MDRSDQHMFSNCFAVLARAAILGVVLASSLVADPLYLVRSTPAAVMSNRRPFPTVIYEYDNFRQELIEKWRLEEGALVNSLKIYESPGLMLLLIGQPPSSDLTLFGLDRLQVTDRFDLSGMDAVSNVRVFDGDGKSYQLEVEEFDLTTKSKKHIRFNDKDLLRNTPMTAAEIESTPSELRLAGPRPAYGTGEHDIIAVRVDSLRRLVSNLPSFVFDGESIPDGIILRRSRKPFVLIANEPTYRALMSIPDQNGMMDRQLLIQDRAKGTWSSYIIKGAETALRPVNGWLIGVVADSSPESEFSEGWSVPPVLGDESVLIHPILGLQMYVDLGPQSEPLWIEASSFYYRVGESLFRATIKDRIIVDRTIVLKNPAMKDIHWAFRGSAAE